MNSENKERTKSAIFDDADGGSKTIYVPTEKISAFRQTASPAVVVQQEGCIELFSLSGVQLMGRSTPGSKPDIALSAPFVSRKHGRFVTEPGSVRYTALKSTNGTWFQGRRLADMETIELKDGDILQIYAGTGIHTDVTIECVFSPDSQKSWSGVIKGQNDALTGLMSRKMFSNWFANNRRLISSEDAYVFLLDVDHFKQINDTFGHPSGDRALITLARTLETALRPYGRAARWGGDEFVGFLQADRAAVVRCFEQIRDTLGRTKIDKGLTVSISAGLTPLAAHKEESLEQLLARADKALYEAKQKGRKQIVFSA